MSRSSQRFVVPGPDVHRYFAEQIEAAAATAEVDLSRTSRAYLAGLLERVTRAERLYPKDAPTTLAELHFEAARAPAGRSAGIWRDLGDRALTIAGVFPESLARATVGVDYYADMGAAAYLRVSAVFQVPPPGHDVFGELGRGFRAAMRLLSEVAAVDASLEDVVRLYERWAATGDARLGERLAALGLLVGSPAES